MNFSLSGMASGIGSAASAVGSGIGSALSSAGSFLYNTGASVLGGAAYLGSNALSGISSIGTSTLNAVGSGTRSFLNTIDTVTPGDLSSFSNGVGNFFSVGSPYASSNSVSKPNDLISLTGGTTIDSSGYNEQAAASIGLDLYNMDASVGGPGSAAVTGLTGADASAAAAGGVTLDTPVSDSTQPVNLHAAAEKPKAPEAPKETGAAAATSTDPVQETLNRLLMVSLAKSMTADSDAEAALTKANNAIAIELANQESAYAGKRELVKFNSPDDIVVRDGYYRQYLDNKLKAASATTPEERNTRLTLALQNLRSAGAEHERLGRVEIRDNFRVYDGYGNKKGMDWEGIAAMFTMISPIALAYIQIETQKESEERQMKWTEKQNREQREFEEQQAALNRASAAEIASINASGESKPTSVGRAASVNLGGATQAK